MCRVQSANFIEAKPGVGLSVLAVCGSNKFLEL